MLLPTPFPRTPFLDDTELTVKGRIGILISRLTKSLSHEIWASGKAKLPSTLGSTMPREHCTTCCSWQPSRVLLRYCPSTEYHYLIFGVPQVKRVEIICPDYAGITPPPHLWPIQSGYPRPLVGSLPGKN